MLSSLRVMLCYICHMWIIYYRGTQVLGIELFLNQFNFTKNSCSKTSTALIVRQVSSAQSDRTPSVKMREITCGLFLVGLGFLKIPISLRTEFRVKGYGVFTSPVVLRLWKFCV